MLKIQLKKLAVGGKEIKDQIHILEHRGILWNSFQKEETKHCGKNGKFLVILIFQITLRIEKEFI